MIQRSRSHSRGRSVLAKRIGRGAEIEADDTPFCPRSDSAGFVDTPIGMVPATALHCPRRLHDLGAVGGQRREVNLPPPFNNLVEDNVDRLYQETLEDFYSKVTTTTYVADHGDETASTSSMQEPDYVVLHIVQTSNVLLPNSGGSNIVLQTMETVRLRRQDAMTTSSPLESTMAMLAWIEAEITTANNRGVRCEKWGITHEAQISWALQKLEEVRSERDNLRTTIEELTEQVNQLSTRLEKGETQLKFLDGVCTFRAADLRNQLLELQERRSDRASAISPVPTTPEASPQSPEILQSVHPTGVREGGEIDLSCPAAVHPPDVSRPSSPDVAGLRDFYETDVQA